MTGVDFMEMYKRFTKAHPTEGKKFGTILKDFRNWQSPVRDAVTREQASALKEASVGKDNILLISFIRNGKTQVRYRDLVTGLFTKKPDRG
jgi:hypothetical protein